MDSEYLEGLARELLAMLEKRNWLLDHETGNRLENKLKAHDIDFRTKTFRFASFVLDLIEVRRTAKIDMEEFLKRIKEIKDDN